MTGTPGAKTRGARFCAKRDWFHPMVVKEVRQGLRSRGFVFTHLGLHGLMVVFGVLLVTHHVAGPGLSPGRNPDLYFWGFLTAVLWGIQPFRAFLNGIRGERKAGTYDLLLMSALTPFEIARGKTRAQMVLSLLMVVSVLPYVVIRHYWGGVELVRDFSRMGMLVLFSWLLVSFCTRMFGMLSRIRSSLVLGMLLLTSPLLVLLALQDNISPFWLLVPWCMLWAALHLPWPVALFVFFPYLGMPLILIPYVMLSALPANLIVFLAVIAIVVAASYFSHKGRSTPFGRGGFRG